MIDNANTHLNFLLVMVILSSTPIHTILCGADSDVNSGKDKQAAYTVLVTVDNGQIPQLR